LGTFNTIKATLPHIRASKGSYIHVSAALHYRGQDAPLFLHSCLFDTHFIGTPYQAHVSAAKAAVDALSAALAVEEGSRGVRSNVITPGPVADTEGMARLAPKSERSDLLSTIPMGRFGDSKDIANAVIFLFSDAASYISGCVFVVDGAHNHIRIHPRPGSLDHLKSRL